MRAALFGLLFYLPSLALAQPDASQGVKRSSDEMLRALLQANSSKKIGPEDLVCARDKAKLAADKWDLDNHIELRPSNQPEWEIDPVSTRRLLQAAYARSLADFQIRCAVR